MRKQVTFGILAHVDAGKTTLSESILYNTGSIKKKGRVDHQDAFLDTFELEKSRGITIFSKQAMVKMSNFDMTLLDTPGHVDFSSEMERTLSVLDYAILLINGADGIQAHTSTLWKLLEEYHIPTFIFVNKMDQEGSNRHALLTELKERFLEECIDFGRDVGIHEIYEQTAMSDEDYLEYFLEHEDLSDELIIEAIHRRKIFPVVFGSALKDIGVNEFLELLEKYVAVRTYGQDFGALIYKITRDDQGNRLTHMKVTGGSLSVKELIANEKWQDKVDQIRIYSGKTYQVKDRVEAGCVCAVTGLRKSKAGQGLGIEKSSEQPVLNPVLSYKLILPDDCNVYDMINNIRELEEEEPHLNVMWKSELAEIHVQVMGEIEKEILKSMILDRFGVEIAFEEGALVYKETIRGPVVGVGHFEPLRHYAEVHLLMEPLPRGSGIEIDALCSEDILGKQYQRLVQSHLGEKSHAGVLTGSDITDMRISVVAGRAHHKHTEGGDFREATFRALRQGLMKARSVLLEPVYNFQLEIPTDHLGRAMTDIIRMAGSHQEPSFNGDYTIISGLAPVKTMMNYGLEVAGYTKGLGKLSLSFGGYDQCHNEDQVIEAYGYNPEEDEANPSSSVFCTKGSGYIVPWFNIEKFMHVENQVKLDAKIGKDLEGELLKASINGVDGISEDEIKSIMLRTYGPEKDRAKASGTIVLGQENLNDTENKGYQDESYDYETYKRKNKSKRQEKEKFLLVDGYNIIHAWDNLKGYVNTNMDLARTKLLDILCDYQSQNPLTLIVVFDAYQVQGGVETFSEYNNIHVVYTKEAETADMYIERLVHRLPRHYQVTVATSDRVEQVIIMGTGGTMLSAQGFKEEVDSVKKRITDKIEIREERLGNKMKLDQ